MWFVVNGGETHHACCGCGRGLKQCLAPLHATVWGPLQMEFDHSLGCLRWTLVNTIHGRPTQCIGGVIGGVLRFGAGHWQPGIGVYRAFIDAYQLAVPVLPDDANQAALAWVAYPIDFSPYLEAIPFSAVDRIGPLKPTIETFALIVDNNEAAFSVRGKRWPDFSPWARGSPAPEIGGIDRNGKEKKTGDFHMKSRMRRHGMGEGSILKRCARFVPKRQIMIPRGLIVVRTSWRGLSQFIKGFGDEGDMFGIGDLPRP